MRKDILIATNLSLITGLGLSACKAIGARDFNPDSASKTPNSTEIDPTLVPFPKIEPLNEKDIKVFLDNCQNCEELGITTETVAGGYFNGDFLFHSKDKNDADYFYLNQGTSFEPLNWESTDSEFALVPKANEGDIYTGLKYFIWNPNVTDDSGNMIVTYQPDGTPNSAQKFILPSNNDIEPRLKRARFVEPEIITQEFITIQEQINQSKNYALIGSGLIAMQSGDFVMIVPDLKVNKDGSIIFYRENNEFQVVPDTLEINGIRITFMDQGRKTWVWSENREWVETFSICAPENFRNCEIPVEALFNGDYFRWLETLSQPFDQSKIKDIPFSNSNPILYNTITAPNFEDPSSAPFRRDVTLGITFLEINNDIRIPYIVKPIEFFDKNEPDKNKWVITVDPFGNIESGSYGDDIIDKWMKIWNEQMNITPIMSGIIPWGASLEDPLVKRTYNNNQDMQARFERFIAGDVGALSKPGIVVLTTDGIHEIFR